MRLSPAVAVVVAAVAFPGLAIANPHTSGGGGGGGALSHVSEGIQHASSGSGNSSGGSSGGTTSETHNTGGTYEPWEPRGYVTTGYVVGGAGFGPGPAYNTLPDPG